MMRNYDQLVEINHYLNWPYISDHPYRILIIGSGSGKTNVLMVSMKIWKTIIQQRKGEC